MSPVRPHKRISPQDRCDHCFPEPSKKPRQRHIDPHFKRWFSFHDDFPAIDFFRKLIAKEALKGVHVPHLERSYKELKEEALVSLWRQIPF